MGKLKSLFLVTWVICAGSAFGAVPPPGSAGATGVVARLDVTNQGLDGVEAKDATIPLFDLDAIDRASGKKRQQMVQAFGDGLKEYGFIAIKADDLSSLVDRVYRETADYFHQPLDVKLRDRRDNDGRTGFSERGRETQAGAPVADVKEFFFIPPNFSDWPEGRPGFMVTMSKYHNELSRYAKRVMCTFLEYVGEPIEGIDKTMESSRNLIRLAYYPAPDQKDDPKALWQAAHRDLNALTLNPPSTVPGLEMLTSEGKWVPVVVPKGYMVVNTGEQIERKTAGMVKAVTHRVRNPGGAYVFSERFAGLFFASWHEEYSLAPFVSCAEAMTEGMTSQQKEAYLAQYGDVTVTENYIARLIEMQTYRKPSESLIAELRKKGLLTQPPEQLIHRYPNQFVR